MKNKTKFDGRVAGVRAIVNPKANDVGVSGKVIVTDAEDVEWELSFAAFNSDVQPHCAAQKHEYTKWKWSVSGVMRWGFGPPKEMYTEVLHELYRAGFSPEAAAKEITKRKAFK